jgi:hypothetical protein
VFTTSPTIIVSPRSGCASRSTIASPVLTPQAHLQVELAIGLVHLPQHVADRHRRSNGPLGVVAVRERSPEDPEDGVAHEFLDPTAVAFDLGPHPLVVRRQERAHVLGVELLGARREADDVDEEDADDAALLTVRLGRKSRPAPEAEARDVRILLTTRSADRHADSLWNRWTESSSRSRTRPTRGSRSPSRICSTPPD